MNVTANRIRTIVVSRILFGCFTTGLMMGLFQMWALAQPPEPEIALPVMIGRRPASYRSPEADIENNAKLIQATRESYLFEGIIGQVRLGNAMQLNYKGQRYTIYQDLDDPDRSTKFDGVNQGVKILVDKGISLPRGLTYYIVRDQDRITGLAPFCLDAQGNKISYTLPDGSTWPKCWTIPMAQAVMRDRNWLPVARVVISSLRDLTGPKASLSSQRINGLGKIPVTTIHETCHILHERAAGEFFWTIPLEPPVNYDVSNYAAGAKKEFVAEVCAGLVLGLNWFPRVLAEYDQYRGPVIPR